MIYMLDTNICIYLIKRKPVHVIEKLTSLHIKDVGISSITVAELDYGVAKSEQVERNRLALVRFLAPLTIIPFESNAASVFGEIRASLEKQGTPIGPYDLLIAAQALANDLVLVSNNIKEFERIPNLKLENWVKS